jgi:cob(I)alamin adenosyltransferase
MTKEDLIGIIDGLQAAINEAVARGPSLEQQKQLDQLADGLTDAQGELVKAIIREDDPEYVKATADLAKVNDKIKADLTAMAQLAAILDGIKQAVELVMAILKLVGVVI